MVVDEAIIGKISCSNIWRRYVCEEEIRIIRTDFSHKLESDQMKKQELNFNEKQNASFLQKKSPASFSC